MYWTCRLMGLLLVLGSVFLLFLDWFRGLMALAMGIGLVGLAEIMSRLGRRRTDVRDASDSPKPVVPQDAAGLPGKLPH